METIIQQILTQMAKKITEKAFSGKIADIDDLATDALEDCKQAAASIIETITEQMNQAIRTDKAGRKELGLTLKEKDRPRTLLTQLGPLHLKRDYYYNHEAQAHMNILDPILGIEKYQRIGGNVGARLVELATEVSYAKSAQITTGGAVSRQTVKNQIRKSIVPEVKADPNEPKKTVSQLHIYADEDHVHMQKENKTKGKKNKITPLVSVTEGTNSIGRRNRTLAPMHFADETFDTRKLWKSVEGYIQATYELESIENIYIHADGGKWIENGLENFPQLKHVMDGYHLEKELKALSKHFPKQAVKHRLTEAIKEDDRKRADQILQELLRKAETPKQEKEVGRIGTYLLSHWDAIVRRKTLNIPGSCTEAQISHILSERFSRDPLGWSEEGLGKLVCLRVYVKNGGTLTKENFKKESQKTIRYHEYADQIIKEAVAGCTDWSIFESTPPIFNGASGTQNLIRGMGMMRNTLVN